MGSKMRMNFLFDYRFLGGKLTLSACKTARNARRYFVRFLNGQVLYFLTAQSLVLLWLLALVRESTSSVVSDLILRNRDVPG